MKRISENIWETEDKKLFHTKLQCFINRDLLPATMKYEKSIGNYPLYEGTDFDSLPNSYKFIMFDFCENTKVHKKTTHVSFLKFKTFDNTWRKYDSIKINNGFHHFEHGFEPAKGYILLCEINDEFPDNIHILKAKELIHECSE